MAQPIVLRKRPGKVSLERQARLLGRRDREVSEIGALLEGVRAGDEQARQKLWTQYRAWIVMGERTLRSQSEKCRTKGARSHRSGGTRFALGGGGALPRRGKTRGLGSPERPPQ